VVGPVGFVGLEAGDPEHAHNTSSEVTSFTPGLYHRAVRVLLLHGFAGDPAAWDAVIAAGLGALEPIAVALPGHGGGPVRDSWQANLDAIDTDGVAWVIGDSLGARVALGLVAAGRIPRATLIGVNPGIPDAERPARRAADAAWARMLREQGLAAFIAAWEAQPLFASQDMAVPADRLAARRARRLALDPEQLARCLETMGLAEMPDYRAALAASDAALVVGERDAKFVAIAKTFPDRPCIEIGSCGHDVLLEQPAALAAAIRALPNRASPGRALT